MKDWIINGALIELKDDGSRISVTADDVYSAVIEQSPRWPDLAPGKHGAAEGLEFSRYPAFLRAVLKDSPTGGLPTLTLEIETQDSRRFPVPNSTLQHDHVIANGSWYPLVPESVAEIQTLMKESGIRDDDFRPPTLRGLLQVKAIASAEGLVRDQTTSGPFVAASYISNDDAVPVGVNAKLYPYQADGWKWLRFIIREHLGGLLADEMGLGKTLQIIAALRDCGDGRIYGPTLVVAPGSLLENWIREIKKFAPQLKALKHHGSLRSGRPVDLPEYDVVVTSYDTVVRDLSLMKMIDWAAVILDEAQNIKNPNALRTKSVKQLPRRVGLAMTGTPVENRLTDLWSIMDFVVPEYLGTVEQFEKKFANDVDDAARLEPLISPLMLRRMVSDVAKDLPERIDIPEVIELTEEEAAEYDRIRQEIAEKYGKAATIVSLIKLRQFCAHPALLEEASPSFDSGSFSKFVRLRELLTEIVQNGEKAIVFTSFTDMADRISASAEKELGVFSATLDGRLPADERQTLIDRFSAIEGPAVLVLNPKAGGSGLNITAANHVIHYNLEWNPALEDQASARSFRRGQTRPVTVRRLFCAGTVEEVVDMRVERKRQISGAAVIGVVGADDDYTDVLAALEKSPMQRD
jgi:SNF2 family DNA or RNA helicase